MILVDTNLLLRIAHSGDRLRPIAADAIQALRSKEQERFGIAPQNLYEMYVVLTRPATANGMGLTASGALEEIASCRAAFELLPETASVYAAWQALVAKYNVQGKRAHDAHLVALMLEHHVSRLLTFNERDFTQFVEIECINPFDVLGVSRT
jgi:predicted nucleic acid-binding protein